MSRRLKNKSHGSGVPPAGSGKIVGLGEEMVPQPEQAENRWLPVAVCVFLALAVWAVFGQTVYHGFINLDDNVYVTDNPRVLEGLSWGGVGWAFTNLAAGFWHPLTWLSLMMDAQLYGLKAGGYHLTNVLLHAATAILLFLVLRNMTGALWRSAFVAALFALHPLHVESVAWVAQRKDVLSTFFFMLTLWAYARYAQEQGARIKEQGARGNGYVLSFFLSPFYWLALFFFTCGLMSKAMLVTVPFVLLLLDYWPLQRLTTHDSRLMPSVSRLFLEKLPFVGLALVGGLLTIHAESGLGALASRGGLPFKAQLANAVLSTVGYLRQTVWPVRMVVYYPYPRSFSPGWVVVCLLLLGLITLGTWSMRRGHRYLVVGWIWYVLTLSPVSGVIQVGGHAHADRYTYVPLVGIFILAVWGLVELWGCWRWPRSVLRAVGAVVLGVLMVAAYVQTTYWRDSASLWKHTLACTPGNHVAHFNMGVMLAAQGKRAEAIEQYELAINRYPNYAEAYNNLGFMLSNQGKWAEAIEQYRQALRLKPDFAEAHNNLGVALVAQGKWGEGIEQYERVLQLKPDYAGAHFNLAVALALQGKTAAAVQHFEQALHLNPDSAKVHFNLGNALSDQKKWPEAIEHYARALQLQPDFAEAHDRLGVALVAQGKWAGAIQHFERALELKPEYTDALSQLAWALATCPEDRLRNGAQAVKLAGRAVALTPANDAALLNTLAAAQAEAGDFMAASNTARKGIEVARVAGQTALAESMGQRLKLYESGRPYRQAPAPIQP